MTVPSAPKQVSRPAIALVEAAIAALLAMSFLALAHPAFLARPAFAADADPNAALAADANQDDAFATASMPSDRESSDSDDEAATDAVVRSEEESTVAGNEDGGAAAGFSLDAAELAFANAGETHRLAAIGTSGSVTWTSSSDAVATVSPEGVVTAMGFGTCAITATDETGAVATCAVSASQLIYDELDRPHYLNPDGSKAVGLQKVGGAVFFFDGNGDPRTGWIDHEGAWYLFDSKTGAAAQGWRRASYNGDDPSWYLFDDEGRMLTGWQKVGSASYCLGESGRMRTGWVKDGGSWHHLSSSGAADTGWTCLAWNGTMSWYLFDGEGRMRTGWQKDGGKWYLLAESGRMLKGWQKDGGSWYHLADAGGAMDTGWIKDEGCWYHLRASGRMDTGWTKLSGTWYHLRDSGRMDTGWVKTGGVWYCLMPNGALPTLDGVQDGTLTKRQRDMVASCYTVPSPGGNLCSEWVDRVYRDATGTSYVYPGDACNMYWDFCNSKDPADLKVGMEVATSSHPHTWAGSIWGHIGIYIGNGRVMDNVGYIRTVDLGSWVWWYGQTHTVYWGWDENDDLSK